MEKELKNENKKKSSLDLIPNEIKKVNDESDEKK